MKKLCGILIMISLLLSGCGSKAPPRPSARELAALQAQVAADEQNYQNYQSFDQYDHIYSGAPEQLWFKPADEDRFYCWDAADDDFVHLLQVAEDRMYYSAMEDYDLWCFSPDGIEMMQESGHRYLIFDYDNGDLSEEDPAYRHDIIFNFAEATRLFRLLRLSSYDEEAVPAAEMSDFTAYSGLSGYDYMVRLPQRSSEHQSSVSSGDYRFDEELSLYCISFDDRQSCSYAISAEAAVDIALREAQKPCYQYQGWVSDFGADEDLQPQLLLGKDGLYPRSEWTYDGYANARAIWSVRLFDANDPLTSLFIYVDALSGAVIGAEDLSD